VNGPAAAFTAPGQTANVPIKFFSKAVAQAQRALRAARRDPNRLDDYSWHGNRHTFASRLVMAGGDLRTVQELGGWRTLAMVQ
jgi:site-specific recombinase XerD